MRAGFVSNGDVDVDAAEVASVFSQGAVSIHGPSAVHDRLVLSVGSFARSSRFLKEYLLAGGRASLCFTVGKRNSGSVVPFFDYICDNLPVVSVVVNPVIPLPDAGDVLDGNELEALGRTVASSEAKLARSGISVAIGATVPFCALPPEAAHLGGNCHAGTLFAVVDHTGDVYVCPDREKVIGNLFRDKLVNLWTDRSEFDLQVSASFVSPCCRECVAYTWCVGGCTSTRRGPDPTTDRRCKGPAAAMRNYEFLVRGRGARPNVRRAPDGLVSIASGARTRPEPFGMFVLTPEGEPFALDQLGRRLMSLIMEAKDVTVSRLAEMGSLSEKEAGEFVLQGVELGILTAAEKGVGKS
jgi:radical SAM protein with 4Fe4S-binding SPASM domain